MTIVDCTLLAEVDLISAGIVGLHCTDRVGVRNFVSEELALGERCSFDLHIDC